MTSRLGVALGLVAALVAFPLGCKDSSSGSKQSSASGSAGNTAANGGSNTGTNTGSNTGSNTGAVGPRQQPHWQVAMTACLKLGAVVVPCITMLTERDIAYRIEHSGARAIITTKDGAQASGLGLSMAYGFIRQSGGSMPIVLAMPAHTPAM